MVVFATRENFLRRIAFAACIGSTLPTFAKAAPALPSVAASPILQCRASLGTSDIEWTIELDEAIPLATVDSVDAPAEYSNGHVRVRLAASGPHLFIGLTSGRLLVTATDGQVLGKGDCKPLISVATRNTLPTAALGGSPKPFHLTPDSPIGTAFAA
jgi:hypothetical protein